MTITRNQRMALLEMLAAKIDRHDPDRFKLSLRVAVPGSMTWDTPQYKGAAVGRVGTSLVRKGWAVRMGRYSPSGGGRHELAEWWVYYRLTDAGERVARSILHEHYRP